MTANDTASNSSEIARELVGNGILMSYPSYNGIAVPDEAQPVPR